MELYDYVKSLYSGNMVLNDRTALNGRELDIYLPDLKLVFEFDGTYWHEDPTFYSEDTSIAGVQAKDIWEKGREKDELCRYAGIRLVRIREHEWKNNSDSVKDNILRHLMNILKKT